MSITSPTFINIDLELCAEEDLYLIAQEWGDQVMILYYGENRADKHGFELIVECSCDVELPEAVLQTFLDLLKTLSPEAQQLLARCHKKVLDIGYDSGNDGRVITHPLSNQILTELCQFGFHIHLTIYPLQKELVVLNK